MKNEPLNVEAYCEFLKILAQYQKGECVDIITTPGFGDCRLTLPPENPCTALSDKDNPATPNRR